MSLVLALALLADTSGPPAPRTVLDLAKARADDVVAVARPALKGLGVGVVAVSERRVGIYGTKGITEAVWFVRALDVQRSALEGLRPHALEIAAQATSVGDALRRLEAALGQFPR